MALVVDLQITAGTRLDLIERLEIRRLTALHRQPAFADDEVHRYVATRYDPDGITRWTTTFEHRFGDGAWKCTLLALQALESQGYGPPQKGTTT